MMMESDASEELLSFRSVVDDPRLQPDPVVLAQVTQEIKVFRDHAAKLGVDAEFIRTMSGLVVEAFRQLDGLPRSDGFWDGTNRRPTQYKLSSFCAKLLRDRPGDTQVLWMAIAVRSVICLGFNPRIWIRLMVAARPDITWPIVAVLCGEFIGSYDTVRDLAAVLTEAGRIREALPELTRMKQGSDHAYVSDWAGKVIDELDRVDKKSKA